MAAEMMQQVPQTQIGDTLIDIRDLKVHFPIRGGLLGRTVAAVKAVDGVDLQIRKGEVLGLVRKRTFQERDISDTQLTEELGDVLWCLAVTADSLGISLATVAERNQAKLTARHPEGWSRSAAPLLHRSRVSRCTLPKRLR